MKILHLTPRFINGGGTIYILFLVRELKKLGYQNSLITMEIDENFLEKNLFESVVVKNYYKSFNFKLIKQILSADVVHAHGRANFPLILLSKILRKKVILQYHGYYGITHTNKFKAWYGHIADKFLNIVVNHLVLCSSSEKELFVEQFNFSKLNKITQINNRSRVIANQITYKSFISPNLKFICISRLGKQKGIPNLLKLIKKLKDDGLDLSLDHYVSSSELPEEYEMYLREIKTLNLSSTINIFKPIPNIHQCFKNYDFMISTSIFEARSLAILEALATGLPVIATNCVGQGELIEDGRGLILPINKPYDEWAKLIKSHTKNIEIINYNIKNGYEFIKREGSYDKLTKEILSVYQSNI